VPAISPSVRSAARPCHFHRASPDPPDGRDARNGPASPCLADAQHPPPALQIRRTCRDRIARTAVNRFHPVADQVVQVITEGGASSSGRADTSLPCGGAHGETRHHRHPRRAPSSAWQKRSFLAIAALRRGVRPGVGASRGAGSQRAAGIKRRRAPSRSPHQQGPPPGHRR